MSDELVTRAKFDAVVAERDRLAAIVREDGPEKDRLQAGWQQTEKERDRLAAQLARQQIELEAGRRIIELAHAHLTSALLPPPGETVKSIDRVNAAYLLLRGEEGSTT